MKVSRPPSPPTSVPTDSANVVGQSGGKEFSAKLDDVQRSGKTDVAPTHSATPAVPVSDISADLKAGRLAPEAAIDRIVERVLERQLGPSGSTALRAQLGAALRESLADDPLLASKVRALLED
jgi:hypothetical protein